MLAFSMDYTAGAREKGANMERIEGGLRAQSRFEERTTGDHPLVSVVTVCLNSEKHIAECIRSVLDQTYDNIEYIIVDGGSGDRTLEIVRDHEENIAYWVSEPDRGIYDAMNKGVGLARGQLVGIINSDDSYFPYTVEEVVEASLQHPEADVFHGDMHVTGEEGRLKVVALGSTEDMVQRMKVLHPACFVRRSVYDRYLYRTEEFPMAADCDLFRRLYSAGHGFHKIDRPLARFRLGGASSHYYRREREMLRLFHEHGLMGTREYHCRRALLVPRASWFAFTTGLVKVLYPQHAVLRRERDYLHTDNIALRDEMARLSAYIEELELEIAARGAEIERLQEELQKRSS
jgi:glycosyltransferase involved in cell wall biosynthesis